MATRPSPNSGLLRHIGVMLTGPATVEPTPVAATGRQRKQPAVIEIEILPYPTSVEEMFVDYAAEGEEPADLALSDLVPENLSNLDLVDSDGLPLPISITSARSSINVGAIDTNPVDSESNPPGPDCVEPDDEYTQADEAFDIDSLTPAGLIQLNQPHVNPALPLPEQSSANQQAQLLLSDTLRVPVAYIDELHRIIDQLISQHQQRAIR